jgi:hypothetical protein
MAGLLDALNKSFSTNRYWSVFSRSESQDWNQEDMKIQNSSLKNGCYYNQKNSMMCITQDVGSKDLMT